ncbi:hypothetical protein [Yimella sp. cx-51]|uniref:hypothetical protein n=1 Tax=Yimella sp. cx-51 TaxID=2770551 RepID=UPI00165EA5AF|nr:hypothetical protein [Yimella sp. cx-51]MBC9958058.1 hypothetical protein [Yimella sp. cx-51]QTH38173.1 hypothetical protein J5M86_00270 [Yimella sp. cx-51]
MIWVAAAARSDVELVELAVDELALEELDELIVLEVVLVEVLLVGAEVVTDVDDEAVLELVVCWRPVPHWSHRNCIPPRQLRSLRRRPTTEP